MLGTIHYRPHQRSTTRAVGRTVLSPSDKPKVGATALSKKKPQKQTLKPNAGTLDPGFRIWSHAFKDVMSVCRFLRKDALVVSLLHFTRGDISCEMVRMALNSGFAANSELSAVLSRVTRGLSLKHIGLASGKEKDRAMVVANALYETLARIQERLREQGLTPCAATMEAARIIERVLILIADHTPENTLTLSDIAKGCLTVDREYLEGAWYDLFSRAFRKRKVLDSQDLVAWQCHISGLPSLKLSRPEGDVVRELIRLHINELVPDGFGLRIQSLKSDDEGRTVVRVQLARGNGSCIEPLGNHGVLVFRPDGRLMDYQAPLTSSLSAPDVNQLLNEAMALGLNRHGTPQLVPMIATVQGDPVWSHAGEFADFDFSTPEWLYTVQVIKHHRKGSDPHMLIYNLDNPRGIRRSYKK